MLGGRRDVKGRQRGGSGGTDPEVVGAQSARLERDGTGVEKPPVHFSEVGDTDWRADAAADIGVAGG